MINKYGLYKTNVPRWEIPGLRSDPRLDEQTQGWWLPMTDEKGDIHMVDTYHISSSALSYKNPLKKIIENVDNNKDYSWTIQRSNGDYYYGGSVKITENTEKYFVEVCDLRDFEIASGSTSDYLEKDKVRNVQFYFEHKYPTGCTLLRKVAQKDPAKIVENCCDYVLSKIGTAYISEYELEKGRKAAQGDNALTSKMNKLDDLVKKVEILDSFLLRYLYEFRNEDKKQENPLTVIAIAGKAGIGKSTFSGLLEESFLKDAMDNEIYNLGISIIPFAEEIKNQAKLLGWNGEKDEKGRKLLQDLTKPIKDYFGQEYYADVVYKKALKHNLEYLIVDDLRFKAEVEYFKKLQEEGKCKLITCKLEKDNFVSGLTKEAQMDISENDLNSYEFDYYIKNNGSLEDLKKETENIVKNIKGE